MPKPSIGRMALALPLLFGVAPALGGYQGGLRKRSHGGNENPTRKSKERDW